MTLLASNPSELPRNEQRLIQQAKGETRPRRIVFVDHTASMSGGEIALLELVRHLNPSDYTPVVVLGSDGALHRHLISSGIETHLLPLSEEIVHTRKDSLSGKTLTHFRTLFQALGYVMRLARFFRETRAEIVHTNSLKSDILGGLAARMARVPVIWHIRDRIETDYLPRNVVRLFRRLCRKIPHYVIANSQATLNTLHLNRSDRQAVIYSGVDMSKYTSLAADADVRSRRTTGAFRVGLVGRISPWKGQHVFVRAAAQVLEQFPNARFLIAGAAQFHEKQYELQLNALIEDLGLKEKIQILGHCEDVPVLMASLDLLVHASTCGEPFGQVVVQGMAAGRPVVATRGGGILEIVEDGVTGTLTPMGDVDLMAQAILGMLRCPERAEEMGRKGYQRVEDRFTVQAAALQAEAIYQEILNSDRRLGLGEPHPEQLAAENTA